MSGFTFDDLLFVAFAVLTTVQLGPRDFPRVASQQVTSFGFGADEGQSTTVRFDQHSAMSRVDLVAAEVANDYSHFEVDWKFWKFMTSDL